MRFGTSQFVSHEVPLVKDRSSQLIGLVWAGLLLPLVAQPDELGDATTVAPPLQPGTAFRDCEECPELVVLPAGSFIMGTPEDEIARQDDEGPQHEVTIAAPFAVSRFHVIVEEWLAFSDATGYILADGDDRPGRECISGQPRYSQTPRHPQVCVDYDDVNAYIAWLAKTTGKAYRMLSESEREYAARAGSTGPFPFPYQKDGVYDISEYANLFGDDDGYSHAAPVGNFPPNAFGLYDMHGNLYEWVADCAHGDYVGAPADGSPWMEDDCEFRQIRGNDWIEPWIFSRSGNRNDREPFVRGDWLGFRVARAL